VLATRFPYFGILPGNLLLLIAVVVFGALFARSAWRLYQYLRLGAPEDRFDAPAERWRTFGRHVLGQGRLLSEPYAGIMHALIFWGFLVITVNTAVMLIRGLIPSIRSLWIDQFPPYLVLLETFELLVLVGVGMALYRRLVSHPLRLNFSADALFILGMIAALMITALLYETFGIGYERATSAPERYLYVGAALARLVRPLGQSANLTLHTLFWWAHMLLVLGFLAYLPHSKHLHIITSPFNVWFHSRKPKGQLSYLDVEKALEEDRPIGVGRIEQFTWKDLLDTYTCTECGRCEAQCPASRTGKPLSPKKLILDLRHHLLEVGPELLRARGQEHGAVATTAAHEQARESASRALVGQVITDETLWDCTTCRACMQACPVFIEHVPKIIDMRRHLAMVESRFGQDVQRLFDNLEASGNPWRFPRATRADWARDISVKTLAEDPEAEVLYWVGCAGSHDERNIRVARAFARLLQRAGVRFAILGLEETCSGDPARRAGNEYLYRVLAQQNVEAMNRYQVKRVVATCPHCFNTLKDEYPQLGGSYQVTHHVEFLAELVREGKLKPNRALERVIAYHDPCYLGRYHDIYDQPRTVLDAIPGVRRREIPGHRERAMCCGAGGARVFMEETRGKRINHLRLEQALQAQPGSIAVACPYCLMMFEDGARAKGVYDTLPVADVAELLEQSLAPDGEASG